MDITVGQRLPGETSLARAARDAPLGIGKLVAKAKENPLRTIAWVLVISVLALGCGSQPPGPPSGGGKSDQPRHGGALNISVPNDPFDWDMTYAGGVSPAINHSAYESLVAFKTGPNIGYSELVLEPSMAERWEISPDAKSFTFSLRSGLRFADLPPVNGRPVTSADVKWSFEYSARAGQFADKKLPPSTTAYAFPELNTIETPNPQTVVVRFKGSFAPFLSYSASRVAQIVPHEIFDQTGHLKDQVVGSGPYQLDVAGSQKGSRWIWKKNPTYWAVNKIYIDELHWLVISDYATANAAFKTKQVDNLGGYGRSIMANEAKTLTSDNPTAKVSELAHPAPTHLYMQVQTPPLDDIRIRQAISLSINRQELIDTFSDGHGGWALAGALPDTFTQDEIKQMLRYDPVEAKRLVSEAGFPQGLSLPIVNANEQYGNTYTAKLQLFQAQLKKGGINLTLVPVNTAEYGQNKRTGSFVLDFSGKLIQGDIDYYLFATFHSTSGTNYGKVKDPVLDKMLEAQRAEPEACKRKELIRQAVRYINVEKVWGLAGDTSAVYQYWQPYVKGFYSHWQNYPNYNGTWLDK